ATLRRRGGVQRRGDPAHRARLLAFLPAHRLTSRHRHVQVTVPETSTVPWPPLYSSLPQLENASIPEPSAATVRVVLPPMAERNTVNTPLCPAPMPDPKTSVPVSAGFEPLVYAPAP